MKTEKELLQIQAKNGKLLFKILLQIIQSYILILLFILNNLTQNLVTN